MSSALDNPIQVWFRDLGERARIAASPRNLISLIVVHGVLLGAVFAITNTINPTMVADGWVSFLGAQLFTTVVCQLIVAKPIRARAKLGASGGGRRST